MGTWFEREMMVRVAAQWAASTASVFIDLKSLAWDTDRPSSRRVAMTFLAYRERKDKTPGKRKLDMKNFLREEGTKTVTSPLTGEKVKLKTLTGPKYQEDPKSKDLLNKLFSEWRDKNREKGDEAPSGEEAPPPKDEAVQEVKAPEVKAPEVKAPAKGETPEKAPSEQDMQEAYDPYVHSRGEPGAEAPAKPQAPAQPSAPAQPETPVEPEAPTAPAPPAATPAESETPAEPETPAKPPSESGPSDEPPPPPELVKQRGRFQSFIDGLRGKDLTPEEIKALDEFDDWLRDLAGLEEREKSKKERGDPEQSTKVKPVPISEFRLPPSVETAVKNKIKPSEMPLFQSFALSQSKQQQQARIPMEEVKKRHHIQDDDEKAVGRVKQMLDKKHQSAQSKYNKAKRQYDRDKAEADKATAEVSQQHDTLRSELAAVGESKETFDSAHTFAKRMEKRQESELADWEKSRSKAEAKGEEPPPKPEPVDAHVEWLKDHKAKWEAQPEATRGEYKPPMVSRELFDKLQKAPSLPEPPEPPPDPPAPPTASDIRQEIEDSDPDLAETLKDVSDADFEALIKPTETKSIAEMKADFIDNTDDPDLKQRVQEMDPDDFEALLAALAPGSGSKGKKRGSLREHVIRLAYSRPDLREALLWALNGEGR